MSLSWDLNWWPLLGAAAMMLLLAGWLLYLDFNKPANRAFAIFLFFRASTMLVAVLRGMSETAAYADYFQRISTYLVIPVVPAILYFLAVYPRRRGILGRNRLAFTAFLAVVAAAELLYWVDHSYYATLAPGVAAGSFLSAGRGMVYTDFGPLILFSTLQFPVMALAAVVILRDFLSSPQGSARFSQFLVFLGFGLNALFDGTNAAAGLFRLLARGEALPWVPWGWAFALLPSLTLLPAVYALVIGARVARDPTVDAAARARVKQFLWLAPFPAASALLLLATGPVATYLSGPLATSILGFWRLALPVLVTYSLVRYQLFDIDLKVKWGIRHAPVAATLITLLLFLVGEGAESLIETRWGPYVTLVAAGAMAFGFKPLERLGERLARNVLPDTKAITQLTAKEKSHVFAEQLRMALEDGSLSAREREMLDLLRTKLGISDKAAARMGLVTRGSPA